LTSPGGLRDAGWLARAAPAQRASASTVANAKLLQLAVKRCSRRLLVAFPAGATGIDGAARDTFVRDQLPALYNELWDLALDADKTSLDCVVLLEPVASFLERGSAAGADAVEVVWSAGPTISSCTPDAELQMAKADLRVESLGDELQEELFGVSYVLYDNINERLPQFAKVAVGGTFDHFHNGHKKLLSITAAVTTQEIVCGITGASMLKDKKFGDRIETIEERKKSVLLFLNSVASPSLNLNLVTIDDPWGPTVVDDDIEAIVVSTEVLKGARLINEERARRGFKPLQVVAVARSNAYTLSSTFVRRRQQAAM